MKKNAVDHSAPIGRMTRVKDFLPPPEALAAPVETVKVTIALRKASVEFFKREAQKHHTKYQRMIRELVDRYAARYKAA